MAGMDNLGNKGKKPQKGGDNNRLAHFGRKRQVTVFDWSAFASPYFAAAMNALTFDGAAVMIGAAQGGTGAVVSLYLDGNKDRRYLQSGEDLLEWCHDILETFGSTSEDIYMSYGLRRRGGTDTDAAPADDDTTTDD